MPIYKFGKLPATKDARTLKLKSYLKPGLPDPPKSYSVLEDLRKDLGTDNIEELFPMDGNDSYGDCGLAMTAHAVTMFSGSIGLKRIPTAEEVIKQYFDFTGGEDSGVNMLELMRYWKNVGLLGHRIEAFVGLDEFDVADMKRAIYMFHGIPMGFIVQTGCIEDFEADKIWTENEPDSEGRGHAVLAYEYEELPDGELIVSVLTWGKRARGTKLWYQKRTDESFAVLPPEAQSPRWAEWIDYAQLRRDLSFISG